MEKIELWEVASGRDTATSLLSTIDRTKTEEKLEEILVRSPDMLERGLQLVGRQTPMSGGGYLDLLAVDGDGRLVVFELKRGTLSRDAVAQVVDYASDLNEIELGDLGKLVAGNSGRDGIPKIDNFGDWYNSQYDGEPIESLKPPRMVLVGLGVDNAAERMVNFLVDRKVEISLVTFQGFQHDAKTLLARYVEVDSKSAKPSTSPYALFERHAQAPKIQELLETVTEMFMSEHSGFLQSHSRSRRHFSLDYSRHAMPEESKLKPRATLFIELDTGIDGINVGFHPIAVYLASKEAFEDLEGHGSAFETALHAPHIGPIREEFKCSIRSIEEWREREEHLTALTRRVCSSYKREGSALAGE